MERGGFSRIYAEHECRAKKKKTPRRTESPACRKIPTTVRRQGLAHLRGILFHFFPSNIRANIRLTTTYRFVFKGRRTGSVEHGHIHRAHGFGNTIYSV